MNEEFADQVLHDYQVQLRAVKHRDMQFFEEHNDEGRPEFIDWAAWSPPKIKLALCRRTAKSCYVQDWDGLEKDWMDQEELDFADQTPEKYARIKVVRDHYPPGLLLEVGGYDGLMPDVRVPLEGEEIEDDEDEDDSISMNLLESDGSESSDELPELS